VDALARAHLFTEANPFKFIDNRGKKPAMNTDDDDEFAVTLDSQAETGDLEQDQTPANPKRKYDWNLWLNGGITYLNVPDERFKAFRAQVYEAARTRNGKVTTRRTEDGRMAIQFHKEPNGGGQAA
jgi:hypothetical protein